MDQRLSSHPPIQMLVDEHLLKSARRFTLAFFDAARGGMNLSLLQTLLIETGHALSRDDIRALCRSLEEKSFIIAKPFDTVEVWRMTERGFDAARGLVSDPDIADYPSVNRDTFTAP